MPSVRLAALEFDEAPDTTVDLPPGARAPGDQIGGYTLGRAIAEGGMGTIHLGRRKGPARFSRVYAIKRLRPHLADDPNVVRMLLEEARFAGAIRHGNVVPVIDVVAQSGEALLVMEYVHGASASQLWKMLKPQPVPVPIAIAIAAGALRGLHAAHEARDEHDVPLRLVHRDVSPHNILIGVDGIARVTDFGIAKAMIAASPATQVGRVKGKLRYLAPEQRIGEKVGPHTDVYGLSVVLWEMLTGRRLWDGETDQEIMIRALRERPRPPSTFSPEVSRGLDAILRRGLESDPSVRFQSARQMAMALEQLGPVASQTEVGDWVARVARDDLSKLAAAMVEEPSPTKTSSRPPQTTSEIRPRSQSKPPPLPKIPPPPPMPQLRPSEPPTALAVPTSDSHRQSEVWFQQQPAAPPMPIIDIEVELAAMRFQRTKQITMGAVVVLSALLAIAGIAAAVVAIAS